MTVFQARNADVGVRVPPNRQAPHRSYELNQLSATVLLPAQIASENCCYTDDGQLREEFAWYPRLVGEIHGLNRELRRVVVEQALPDLTSSQEALAEGGYWPL